MNSYRNLFKLYGADNLLLATLTARNEDGARAAYAADNPAAKAVHHVEQVSQGYPCEMFRIFA